MKKISKIQTARNYALALYEAAADSGSEKKVFDDCTILKEALTQTPEIVYLQNPAWKAAQRKETVDLISRKLKLSAPTANLFQLIAENGRIGDFEAVLNEFKHIFYQKRNIKEITVESAQELSVRQNKELIEGLEKALGTEVAVDYIINPEVLGGLIVRSGSLRIDDSLSGKLHRLEQMMKGKI